ncbi:Coenzyme F420 hydrogenase/dehydrogenase, beta subunit C-terminal domain [Beduini massiliensis]|uniref:Coenzyme F420 hydrogenase/dehydrogenase, beta subunit C-terminal domain n=1 Tax=Beduini massiliensis TaxID=1585974 RepID=UPI00059AA7BB|nr:Coenzyme F420 hydrogenase/dehydrogenase, beta subunit C-terminal domain [Beduini massiliensis]
MSLNEFKKDSSLCSGCTLCSIVCPTKAITYKSDLNGFIYPKIDNEKCIECSRCDKICHINTNESQNSELLKGYAFINNSKDELLISSSGGAFISIVKAIFKKENNVSVYGAEMFYEPNVHVRHTRATTIEEARKFSGSKYIYSDIKNILSNIIEDIYDNKFIIFSGLPCQIKAIKNYLSVKNVDSKKIMYIDLVCHGTSSKGFFDNFINMLEKKYKSKVIIFKFREKKLGWKGYPCYVKFQNGKELKNTFLLRNYPVLYLKGLLMRKSCFNCQFSSSKRISDITLGDFWGIEKIKNNLNTKNGISMITINSEKGLEISSLLSNFGTLIEVSIPDIINEQDNMQHGHNQPTDYDSFWKSYEKFGITYVLKKYGSLNLKGWLRYYFKKLLIQLKVYIIYTKIRGK